MRGLVDYFVKKTIFKDVGFKFLETNTLLKSFKREKPYIVDIHAWKKKINGLSTKHLIAFARDIILLKIWCLFIDSCMGFTFGLSGKNDPLDTSQNNACKFEGI